MMIKVKSVTEVLCSGGSCRREVVDMNDNVYQCFYRNLFIFLVEGAKIDVNVAIISDQKNIIGVSKGGNMFEEPAQTHEEVVKDAVKAFVNHSNDAVENLIINHTLGFNLVWNNPNATPAEVFSVLGTQGGKAFADSYATQLLIKQLKPSYELLVPPLPYTIAEDGTVTIGA